MARTGEISKTRARLDAAMKLSAKLATERRRFDEPSVATLTRAQQKEA